MKDPWPFQAPAPLVRAVKPFCDALNLPTLPMHIHEVLFALTLYTAVQNIFAPWISNIVVPVKYAKFNRRTRINWNVHIVSLVQSTLVCSLSLWLMRNDKERKFWAQPEQWDKRLWSYDGVTGLLQSFALGYFLWDLYMCSRYVYIFGWGMLAHAISAVTVFSFGYRPFVHFYAPTFLLYELSSPFLNVHWFCDKLDLTGSIYQAVNGALLITTFFFCRIVWGAFASWSVFWDCYRAYSAGHSVRGSEVVRGTEWPMEMLEGGKFTHPISGLRYSNIDVKTGDVSAMMSTEKYMPLWLAGAYLASNLVLNLLNYFWLAKMIQTVRSRFDPPYGTKGIGKNKVDGRPKEKDEISRILGEGEVPMDGKLDEIENDVKRAGGTAQDVDVARALYADGHKGVEVTSRSVRSRRKA